MRERAFLLLLAAAALPAQVKQIRESPAASVSQDLGLTHVEISYHRPAVKGRVIWGGLVPYGQVWRAGANEATTISFSTAVKVAGHEVPGGTYAFFAIPGKERWTLILDKEPKQWGAFDYKPEQDLLRFEAAPEAAPMQERLDYTLEVKDQGDAIATLHWEKLAVSFPISADVDGVYQAYLADELKKADASKDPKERWEIYFSDAKYWVGRGERLDEAAATLDKAAAIRDSFRIYDLRARLLQKQGHVKEALPLLDKAMSMAPAQGAPKEYVDGLAALKAEWSK
ncbi:MAG TPA: DUF2911 domain-containing protein [Holophagaceae bacterium]|nr:DUF2911 domain-containing protein [Holophagaceae bacterium]